MADERYYCSHHDCVKDKKHIPYDDVPYVKMEVKDGKYVYTCLKHMTDIEIAERYDEAYKAFEIVEGAF